MKSRSLFQAYVKGKHGLEIGGPSGVFQDQGILPLYWCVGALDNCVFSEETLWEGVRKEGQTFLYYPKSSCGLNLVREATDLRGISNHSYDFVLSAHTLEHVANPIKALEEWKRVVMPAGALVLVLPNYVDTFDHNRQPTPLSHMVEDFRKGVDEGDTTHLEEILKLHDLSMDPEAGTREEFISRSLMNFQNRCLHHHVFDAVNIRELLRKTGFEVIALEKVQPHHLVTLSLARC